MPTYDYVCAGCGHAFEAFQEMSAKKLRTCPKCRKPRLERQVGTGAGLIFKGSGFYITDYKKSGDAGSKPVEGAGGSGAGGSSTGASAPSGSGTGAASPPAPVAPTPPAGGTSSASGASSTSTKGGSRGKGAAGRKGGGRKA